MSNVQVRRRRISNIQHGMSNVQVRGRGISNIQIRKLVIGYWTLDIHSLSFIIGHSLLDIGHWIFGFVPSSLEIPCWIFGFFPFPSRLSIPCSNKRKKNIQYPTRNIQCPNKKNDHWLFIVFPVFPSSLGVPCWILDIQFCSFFLGYWLLDIGYSVLFFLPWTLVIHLFLCFFLLSQHS